MRSSAIRGSVTAAIIAAAAFSAPCTALAQQADPASEMVLVTHEVGDLVVDIPDYNAESGAPAAASNLSGFGGGGMGGGGGTFGGGGGLGGGGGGIAASSSDGSRVTLDSLISAIVSTIAHASWAENGGGDAQIEPVGTTLVVLQTRRAHDQISQLLVALRQGSAGRKSVTVDARWLLLDSDDLDLLVAMDDAGAQSINREVLAEFTRRPTSLRAMTNCFSGQRTYLVSGTRRNVVRSYIPVVGSVELPDADALWADATGGPRVVFAQLGGGSGGGRNVGYQPIVETPNSGALLVIRPTLMQGANAAVVDLTSTITFDVGEPGAGEAAAAPMIDRVAIDQHELATTLRVPLGEPTLVGGMSHIGAGNAPAPAAAAEGELPELPQLYLVLEIR